MELRSIPASVWVAITLELVLGAGMVDRWLLSEGSPTIDVLGVLGVLLAAFLPLRSLFAYRAFKIVLAMRVILGGVMVALAFVNLSYSSIEQSPGLVTMVVVLLLQIGLLFAMSVRPVREWYGLAR